MLKSQPLAQTTKSPTHFHNKTNPKSPKSPLSSSSSHSVSTKMMKLSAKPKSSPGRPEKYPPPLMRFMKTNVGSRSRGRSRSSPMFPRRKSSGAGAGETQEPSSPKVTCMGQVRARRPKMLTRVGSPTRRRCWWLRDALFCSSCRYRPDLGKWVLFFRDGFRRKARDCPEIEPEIGGEPRQRAGEPKCDAGEEEEAEVFASSSNLPPINALLLTRCRSAPYRSSSLASKFWGSPLRSNTDDDDDEEEEEEKASKTEQHFAGDGNGQKPTSETEPISLNSGQNPKPETDEFEGSVTGTTVKSDPKTDSGAGAGAGAVHPLLLTRCKSEPARTAGEKVDPEMNFWNLRRFGEADSCSRNVL